MPQKHLPTPLLIRLNPLPYRLALQKVTVIPRMTVEHRVIHLQNPRRDPVQKIPVMRHKQNRPWKILQITLQPHNRLRIQVVGRLIQQQNIRLRHQRPRQRHPTLLPS